MTYRAGSPALPGAARYGAARRKLPGCSGRAA